MVTGFWYNKFPHPTAEKEVIDALHPGYPIRIYSSLSYVEVVRKKPSESSGSSEDESFERPSKKAGRKYHREAREEEVERKKMQGSQTTL